MGTHWWLASYWQSAGPVFVGSWIIWVVLSIILHELGHGIAALHSGDDTPRYTGHMTWNPLVHIPPMAWLMFLLFGFTWGLMPVNPSNFRGRYDDAKVAAAGPMVNLFLLIGCCLAGGLWLRFGGAAPSHIYLNIRTFLLVGAMINAMGVLFNLIPIPPLDGSRILGDFYPNYGRLFQGEQGAIAGLLLFMLLFTAGADYLWDWALLAAIHGTGWSAQTFGAVPTP
ncbi:MAG: site-2 protease family protein [Phycisphaerales bacterium]|nr:site-2 protease family protein [Phycisphaerales bacterium]